MRLTPVRKGRAIFSRRRADPAGKGAAKDFRACKAANISHFVERQCAAFELPPSRFYPQVLDMPSRGFPDFFVEYAGKITRTHGRSARKSADR